MDFLAQALPDNFWRHQNGSSTLWLWTFIGLASYLYPEQFPKGL